MFVLLFTLMGWCARIRDDIVMPELHDAFVSHVYFCNLSMVIPRKPQFVIATSSKFMDTRSADTPSASVTASVIICGWKLR